MSCPLEEPSRPSTPHPTSPAREVADELAEQTEALRDIARAEGPTHIGEILRPIRAAIEARDGAALARLLGGRRR